MTDVYIAGPMTGLPEHNYPAFCSLERWIWEHDLPGYSGGVYPVNPALNFEGDTTREYAAYLRADLPQLVECDAIVLLPGWEGSMGARLEAQIAGVLKMKFFYAEKIGIESWEIREGEAPDVEAIRRSQLDFEDMCMARGKFEVNDNELPGMWSASDFTGGQTDAEDWRAANPAIENGWVDATKWAAAKEPEPELIEQEAARLVRNGARQKNYGHPRGDFDTIGALWSPILGIKVTAEHVALCMIALKLARLTSNPKHHDSLVDIIGYAICYDRLDEPQGGEL